MANITHEFIHFVRSLIGDQDTVTFTDERIKELIAVAARLVIQDAEFTQTYTISILGRSIDPNPFDVGDQSFINLVALKAGCILDMSQLHNSAGRSGIHIVQEKTSINTSSMMPGYKILMENGFCKSYADARDEYNNNNSIVAGYAIFGPIKTIDGFPDYGTFYENRYCR